MHDPVVQGGLRVMREDPGMQADRHTWVEGWRAESEVLLARARADGPLTADTDPGRSAPRCSAPSSGTTTSPRPSPTAPPPGSA
jgi:hypothetical protein